MNFPPSLELGWWFDGEKINQIIERSNFHLLLMHAALTKLLLNWASKKWVATCPGNRLNRILLLEVCSDSISCFSSLACAIFQKKENIL